MITSTGVEDSFMSFEDFSRTLRPLKNPLRAFKGAFRGALTCMAFGVFHLKVHYGRPSGPWRRSLRASWVSLVFKA